MNSERTIEIGLAGLFACFFWLGFFAWAGFFLFAVAAIAAWFFTAQRNPRQPTAADAAFTPSRQRWQAVVVTAADKRGRPTERMTVLAESSAHLEAELLAHFGYIESAGLYEFRRRKICGIPCGFVAELTQPLLVNPAALFLVEAERWRQKNERVRR